MKTHSYEYEEWFEDVGGNLPSKVERVFSEIKKVAAEEYPDDDFHAHNATDIANDAFTAGRISFAKDLLKILED